MRTLATEEIGKSYRGRRVVNGVSLEVRQGEVVGLLGPNGAGKTTTFYAIVGLIPPDTGRVLYDGQDITDVPMYLRARQYGISYLPQEASVFRKLTVEENILAVLEAQPISWHERREKMEKFIDELGLEHIRQNRGYALSGGERRREVTSPLRRRRRSVPAEVLKNVKGIELRARNLVNTLFTGEYRSVFRGQGIEFAEVREYQHGDDFRAIDWNVSARMGHPFVKTFMEERELTLLLIVDQSGSLHFGRPYTKAGLAVEVAAVLALAAARHNDRVGTLLFADAVEYVVRPAKGRAHAMRVIRDLVAFAPRGRGTNLAGALRYAAKLLRHRAIVVVLSDFRAEGWEEALAQVAARHEVVAITVDDPREYDIPDAGWVELEDAETRQRHLVDTSHAPTRTRIRVAAERLQQERTRKLLQAGVDRVALHTTVPYGPPLRRAFAERARRMSR